MITDACGCPTPDINLITAVPVEPAEQVAFYSSQLAGLLGGHPGPDMSLAATASLAGHDTATTRRALHELARAHLIIEHSPGRYTLHDLLRTYAAELLGRHGEAERQAALRRVIDFHTHTACAAEHLLNPNSALIRLDPPVPGVHPHPLPDPRAALAWLDAEHTVLLAAQQAAVAHAWHPVVWQLAWATNEVHGLRGHRHDHVAVWQAALDASAHLPDLSTRMHAHRRLGSALVDLGHHDDGIAHLRLGLALAEEHHDIDHQANTHRILSWAWDRVLPGSPVPVRRHRPHPAHRRHPRPPRPVPCRSG